MVDTVELPILSKKHSTAIKAGNRENIGFDELGNAVWQFEAHHNVDLETASRPDRRLENPALELVDETPPEAAALRTNANGLQAGYNPYDSGTLAGKVGRRPRDLRKLSKWIELRKKLGSSE